MPLLLARSLARLARLHRPAIGTELVIVVEARQQLARFARVARAQPAVHDALLDAAARVPAAVVEFARGAADVPVLGLVRDGHLGHHGAGGAVDRVEEFLVVGVHLEEKKGGKGREFVDLFCCDCCFCLGRIF